MGGEDHGTIRVSVLEQMADAHLARVDDFTMQGTVLYARIGCATHAMLCYAVLCFSNPLLYYQSICAIMATE